MENIFIYISNQPKWKKIIFSYICLGMFCTICMNSISIPTVVPFSVLLRNILFCSSRCTIYLIIYAYNLHFPRNNKPCSAILEKKTDRNIIYLFSTSRKATVTVQLSRSIAQAVSRWLPTAAARDRDPVMTSGICGGQSCTGAGFLRVLRFPLPIFIPLIAPQSSSSIIWGWYNRPVVAAVPSGLSLTPLRIIKK
jgi:hypothetical protein